MSELPAGYQKHLVEAVRRFWATRSAASEKQLGAGRVDQGERSGVTGGKNLSGFADLLVDVVRQFGPDEVKVWGADREMALPGYYRPSKMWDVVAMYKGELIAAIELKSHIGPSFGNNFNNRTEEALGNANDFWAAFEEGAYGHGAAPFLGWLILVEDHENSRKQVANPKVPPGTRLPAEFVGASYLARYERFSSRLMAQGLYTQAAVVASPRDSGSQGAYRDLSAGTSAEQFIFGLERWLTAYCVTIRTREPLRFGIAE